MSDDEIPDPTGLSGFKYSLSNLYQQFGTVDNLVVGTIINLSMTLLGVAAYVGLAKPWAYIGAVWALLHVAAILDGVIRA